MAIILHEIDQAFKNAFRAMMADLHHFNVKKLPYGSHALARTIWAEPEVSKDYPLAEQKEALFAKSLSSIAAKRSYKSIYDFLQQDSDLAELGAIFTYKILPRFVGDVLFARVYVEAVSLLPVAFEALPRPVVKHVITETFYPLKDYLIKEIEGYQKPEVPVVSELNATVYPYNNGPILTDSQDTLSEADSDVATPRYLLEEMYGSGMVGVGVQMTVSIIFTGLHAMCASNQEFAHEKTMRIGTAVFLSTLCTPLRENIVQVTYMARDTILEIVDLLPKYIAAWWVTQHHEAASMPPQEDTHRQEECGSLCVPLMHIYANPDCRMSPAEGMYDYDPFRESAMCDIMLQHQQCSVFAGS